jgi:dTDP-4-dehydrorhamnose 3,5-epimerase
VKLLSVRSLAMPAIKVLRFGRFADHRGYFTEPFRKSEFQTNPLTPFMAGIDFRQENESFSKPGVVRGLHFQWNPYMGKLVRTIQGHMVDLVLDIRKGSPTFGKIIAHDMKAQPTDPWNEWIWVPPGFAHGNFFPETSVIEYFCSGEYNPACEAGISPLAEDIDWSLCDGGLLDLFRRIASGSDLISDKDRQGLTVAAWASDARSVHFEFAKLGDQ